MTFDKIKDISLEKDNVIYDLVSYDIDPDTDYVVLNLEASLVKGMVDAENSDEESWMSIDEFEDVLFIDTEAFFTLELL